MFLTFVSWRIFLRTDIRNTNTWKFSMNGHELSIEIVFFFKYLTYSITFSFLIGWGVGRWKKKTVGRLNQSTTQIFTKIYLTFPGFVFFWKKIWLEKQMLVKQNVLEYNHGLTSLLDFVFSVNPSILETIEI
jgi:hypothetical protein